LYVNWNYVDTANNLLDINNILIGSSPIKEFQWNWIINYLKTYKK
jgi:hypothetical protein